MAVLFSKRRGLSQWCVALAKWVSIRTCTHTAKSVMCCSEVKDAFKSLEIQQNEIDDIFTVVATVLHMSVGP